MGIVSVRFVEQPENLNPCQRDLLKLVKFFALYKLDRSRLDEFGCRWQIDHLRVAEQTIRELGCHQRLRIEGDRIVCGCAGFYKHYELQGAVERHSSTRSFGRGSDREVVQELTNPKSSLTKEIQ